MKQLCAFTLIFSTLAIILHGTPAAAWEPNDLFESKDIDSYEMQFAQQDIESDILHVTSDAMEGVFRLQSLIDSNLFLLGLKSITANHVSLDMNLDALAKGVLLLRDSGYNILTIKGNELKPEGGNLDLIYLDNAVFRKYVKFPMSLIKSEGHWSLETRNSNGSGTKFNAMHLSKRTFAGQTIGIEKVTVSQE